MVGQKMNRRIRKKFDELGIEIPYPGRCPNRQKLKEVISKEVISEVLEEQGVRSIGVKDQAGKPDSTSEPTKSLGERHSPRSAPQEDTPTESGDSE